ncbi:MULTISPECIES: S41 family peptidase [unclassified Kaistella]|uniref:S41 family peptidase n=1 Tax=unclassified Kaistella TaxID=2762626 RepID=UPI0027342E64|nr:MULTISPECIES: S41 family peptidase [unclassified Kaistella]MDP2453987.1 S41 family peptidase [Kaistella sp. SH11-4b]MDP2457044.1 S41 family peptidase [Kaistella sp. SH40-3]MDP2459801.1 S41 family peptidase [Kaistella sp. SH19-2b]
MKKFILFCLLFIISSCVSVKKHNEKLEIPISVEHLKKDIDFAHQKLEKLHPKLYWYISKEDLNHQFDSLKTTINKPLKPNEFYQKLAPIIANIKEGHLRLNAYDKRLTKKEIKHLKNQKGLLNRYNFVIDNDRIFVKDNVDKIPNMYVGTEIVAIKDILVKDLLQKYKPLINSDGENTTFQKYSMARRWPSIFTAEYGILDSVKIEAKYQNEIKTFYIHREKITKEEKKKTKQENKKQTKSETGKTKDYNIITKSFNRDLQFPTKDSTVAYLKIKTFSGTYSRKFYKQSFATLKKSPARYLILDVRDNLGGSLSEINNLYSYLVSEEFKFINDIELTSRTSMFYANYFNDVPVLAKPIAAITYPIYLIGTAFSVKKKQDKFYLKNNDIFPVKKPKKNHFNGKIYVLINGSSFSASSIISSKLKGDKRAFLVGEETGGANDGTVAGRYSTEKLPYSKLKLPIGLMLIQPNIKFTETKKGVLPDLEIIPTLQQILQKKDVQLEWVMEEIKKQKVAL